MRTISKREEKIIASLKQKKYRSQHSLFVAEGEKLIQEVLNSDYDVVNILLSKDLSFNFKNDQKSLYLQCDDRIMKRLSNLTSPPGAIAVISTKLNHPLKESAICLMLDRIQDPGNLGTILRSAAAFGVKTVICSSDTVDCYSPKVVQASMGALFHLNIVYTNLADFLKENVKKSTIYGAHLEGENLYQVPLKKPAIVVMGNEANGVSLELNQLLDQKIRIPHDSSVESLNVSMATTVILAEFRRRMSEL